MKERITLIYSNYDENTSVSTVIIDTDLGRFTGTCVLREEDREIASSYCGCRYAELKAIRNYLKALLRVKKAERETLVNLYNAFYSSDKTSLESREFNILDKAIIVKVKEVNEVQKNIKNIGQKISNSVAERDKMLKRIQESRAKEIKE